MSATALKVLIVLTSHAQMGSTAEPTGFWLEEFTTPYYAFVDAGAEVTLASIRGGAAPIDPRSLQGDATRPASVQRYLQDDALRAALTQTTPVERTAAEAYDIVFLPGGHGTMWDLPQSEGLARLVAQTFERGDVVAAVCHGPAGLVTARTSDGKPLVQGRRVAGFTNGEERAVGLADVVPFLLESKLRELGGRYESGPDFQPFAIADGNLVTGQNPTSSTKAAELALEAARARQQTAR
ncbi:MAG: type 1 glutamine amidotransferase domain-containing protein [Steroidobacteraceae bacterium]